MAPEQLQGKPRTASDQYALGIIVYEWLSGVHPFPGADYIEIASKHLLCPPPPLHEKMLCISPALDEIVLRTLAKDPHERFESVQAFADALEHAAVCDLPLPDRPTHSLDTSEAAPLADTRSGRRTFPRRAVIAGLAGGTGLAMLAGGWKWLTLLSNNQKGQAGPPSLRHLSTKRPVTHSAPAVGAMLYIYHGHVQTVTDVAWSPDSTRIASGSTDGTIQVWDALTGNHSVIHQGFSSLGAGHTVTWSPNGKYIASTTLHGTVESTVQVWDATTGKTVANFDNHSAQAYLTWSPDGKYLVAANNISIIQVWNAITGDDILLLRNSYGFPIISAAWSPDAKYLACDDDGGPGAAPTVQIWDIVTGRHVYTYPGHMLATGGWSPTALAWSPNDQRIASGSNDGTIHVWDAFTGRDVVIYHSHASDVPTLAWSPDSKYIVSTRATMSADVNQGRMVDVWNAATGEDIFTYSGHHLFVNTVAWSPNGTYIASAGEDHSVQVWQAV